MSARFSFCLPVLILVAMGIILAGCVSTNVGDVSYKDGNVTVLVTSPSRAEDSYIQVTIYRVADLHQEETAAFGTPVSLVKGENVVTIPAEIGPGDYKLFVYIIQDGTRRTAVIRDIRV